MRILDIAIFMLIFNLFLGFFSNVYGVASPEANATIPSMVEGLNGTVENMTEAQFMAWQWQVQVVNAWNTLWNILAAAFALGFFLQHLFPFIPVELAAIITTIVDAIYIVGVVQFISGRSTGAME